MGRDRYLLVTIDTEVDKDPAWLISCPPTFRSVTHGVPEVFTPLFRRYGVRPTYLLSYEVLEDQASCHVLAGLKDEAEMGTHLHIEFVPPDRQLCQNNMGGQAANAIQAGIPSAVEAAKLANLTDLFCARFGYRPVSFRSGRFGISDSTPSLLAQLGYIVDSSVAPGQFWDDQLEVIDFRKLQCEPHWLETSNGHILELPISITPGSALAPILRGWTSLPGRIARKLLGTRGQYNWLRPSWRTGEDLVRYVRDSEERFLVMILHSTEIIPGASPYARTQDQADRIVSAMDHLFSYARQAGISFCTMAEAAKEYSRGL